MATITKFEELEIWKISRKLYNKVSSVTERLRTKKEFRFAEQMKSSAGSVMDNIAEGFGRGSRLEFISGLNISRGETDELKSQLYRGLDNKYFSEIQFTEFYGLADEVTKMNTSLITYLNKSKIKGQRFKERL